MKIKIYKNKDILVIVSGGKFYPFRHVQEVAVSEAFDIARNFYSCRGDGFSCCSKNDIESIKGNNYELILSISIPDDLVKPDNKESDDE